MAEKKTDRRTLRTQKALRDALAEMLTEKELQKITVQEIADKADVNRVTFYKHFLDVYDLYEKMEQTTLLDLGVLVLRLESLPPEEIFSNLIGYVAENRMIFRMIFCPNIVSHLRTKLENLIEGLFLQLQSEKSGVDIHDKELVYLCCYRAQGCLAVISKWVENDFADPQDVIVRTITALDASTVTLFSEKRPSKR
ncbi:MAG: TetR/AcrR family transcriptional regulator [Oscillospiraceae bacterium]|nr:TetR/AcrR family transcriptional regulator [Oscillospiraceae bacterium]